MKRIFAYILAAALAVSALAVPISAAGSAQTSQEEMLSVLAIMSVMNGDEKGDLNLGGSVTRAQFAKMAVAASPYAETAGSNTGISPFSDMSAKHWASSYVTAARDLGWLTGYLDGTFRPDEGVTLAEAATVVLHMLGYGESFFTGSWPSGQMGYYHSLGLDKNISATQNSKLSRLQCAWLVYNALGAVTAAGKPYAQTLGYALDASGNISYLGLINSKIDGPVIAGADWTADVGFTPDRVYKNDQLSTPAAVSSYDALYYIESISTVWAYSGKHTGTLDAVLPGKSAPTSVTVSGVTYALGSPAASVAVSSVGSYGVGDTVTLLMGRDGAVAGIVGAKTVDDTVYGVVTGSGSATYSTPTGGYYSSKYVQVLGADGQSYKFNTSASISTGAVVKAAGTDTGVSVSVVSSGKLSGKVASASFGGHKFADDAQILDAAGDTGAVISLSRLEGRTLGSGDVLFYALDSDSKISVLILDDATGDCHRYGMLTAAEQVTTGAMDFKCYYSCLVNGAELAFTISNTTAGASANSGVKIEGSGAVPTAVKPLSKAQLSSLGQASAQTVTGETLAVSGRMQVYVHKLGGYYYASADQVSTASYTLYGWYDTSSAGAVRVLVAEPK